MHACNLVITFVLGILTLGVARAENPNATFNARIMVSTKRFPASAKSPSLYVAAIRKQAGTNFVEDKSTHSWKLYLAGFLKTKLDDVEYMLKIYEVGGRSQQLLKTFDQYTDERGQQTILTNIVLDKTEIGVNKEILITMESKGKVLASGRVKILGEGERFSGKVDFSGDEDADDGAKKPEPKK